MLIPRIRLVAFFGFLITTGVKCPPPAKPCPVTADIWVRKATDSKPHENDVLYVCPGDQVIVGWSTSHANSVELVDPDPSVLGLDSEIIPAEGEGPVTVTADLHGKIKAKTDACSKTAEARVEMISDGDYIDLQLQPDGKPAVWSATMPIHCASEQIFITKIGLPNGCEWEQWAIEKLSDPSITGGPLSTIVNVQANEEASLGIPLQFVGVYKASPIPDQNGSASANDRCSIVLRLYVKCIEN